MGCGVASWREVAGEQQQGTGLPASFEVPHSCLQGHCPLLVASFCLWQHCASHRTRQCRSSMQNDAQPGQVIMNHSFCSKPLPGCLTPHPLCFISHGPMGPYITPAWVAKPRYRGSSQLYCYKQCAGECFRSSYVASGRRGCHLCLLKNRLAAVRLGCPGTQGAVQGRGRNCGAGWGKGAGSTSAGAQH